LTVGFPGTVDVMSTTTTNPAHDLGRRGEDLAANHLRRQGMALLHRNWRCAYGELDLVATDGIALVVCEVKTRSRDCHGTPAEAVTPVKTRHIRNAAREWVHRYGVWLPVRFDVLAVLWPDGSEPRVEHLRGAFR
jgi:putative endonuclease